MTEYLASLTPGHGLAWDCATGSGQAAIALARYFSRVVGTDASQDQVDQAVSLPNVVYRVEPAERTRFQDGSVDLVTVAQALHWFDLQAFTIEVDRILKKGGILAIWSYGMLRVNNQIDAIIYHLYENRLGSYWPPERSLVEAGYAGLDFSYARLSEPQLAMKEEWNLKQLVGYLNTWSAVKRYRKEHIHNPVIETRQELLASWGDEKNSKAVEWPLTLKVWKK